MATQHSDTYMKGKQWNALRAAAETLHCSRHIHHHPDMNELYDLSIAQPTCLESDIPMADPDFVGLTGGRDRVLVHYSGQDTARSAWARECMPLAKDYPLTLSQKKQKERIERSVREANFSLMQEDLLHTEVYFGKNKDFMGRIHLLVPKKYAKLAYDLNLNFIRKTPEQDLLYSVSKQLPFPDLWIVCDPDWQPKATGASAKDNKRLQMLLDLEGCTSYLLGARYFGEVKKACLTMIWHAALSHGIGMPIHGSSKTLHIEVPNNDYNEPFTFLTLGLSGTGKSTVGSSQHTDLLDPDNEPVRLGNDDAIVILYDPSDPMSACVGLEEGCYNKSNDYDESSPMLATIQSAENVLIRRDREGNHVLTHEDAYAGNGRVQTARHRLPGTTKELDTPHPDCVALLMRDEVLPPVLRVIDPSLFIGMYMSLASRTTNAENVPIEQIGRLRIVPGANPFNTWGFPEETRALEQLIEHATFEGLVLNTGGFFSGNIQGEEPRAIPKELTLSIYPKLAKNQIQWQDWHMFPGLQIPDPKCFEDIYSDFSKHFHPLYIRDKKGYRQLLFQRLKERIHFLQGLTVDQKYIKPFVRALQRMQSTSHKQPTILRGHNHESLFA